MASELEALKRELHALKGEQHDLHQRKRAPEAPGRARRQGIGRRAVRRTDHENRDDAARASAGPPSTATAT